MTTEEEVHEVRWHLDDEDGKIRLNNSVRILHEMYHKLKLDYNELLKTYRNCFADDNGLIKRMQRDLLDRDELIKMQQDLLMYYKFRSTTKIADDEEESVNPSFSWKNM